MSIRDETAWDSGAFGKGRIRTVHLITFMALMLRMRTKGQLPSLVARGSAFKMTHIHVLRWLIRLSQNSHKVALETSHQAAACDVSSAEWVSSPRARIKLRLRVIPPALSWSSFYRESNNYGSPLAVHSLGQPPLCRIRVTGTKQPPHNLRT